MAKTDILEKKSSSGAGVAAAFCAFVCWGILPVFWKALSSVDPFEVLCHRITWSFAAIAPFMLFRGRLGGLLLFLRSGRNFLGLLLSGFLLAGNWYLYIWAIMSNKVVEASLGYYITPLVNIFCGIIFFREKASRLILLSIAVAAMAVLYQVGNLGHLPYVPLGLAFSFAAYGLLRKILAVEALPGLFVETLAVLPPAVAYLIMQAHSGNSAFFRHDLIIDSLLISSGLITSVPLLCFAYGARRIRMTTLGILQYMTPTCVLLLGILLYGEAFTQDTLITFVLIWIALVLYSWDTLRQRQS
jgi:chloramphenicol-sensitive protein RarD